MDDRKSPNCAPKADTSKFKPPTGQLNRPTSQSARPVRCVLRAAQMSTCRQLETVRTTPAAAAAVLFDATIDRTDGTYQCQISVRPFSPPSGLRASSCAPLLRWTASRGPSLHTALPPANWSGSWTYNAARQLRLLQLRRSPTLHYWKSHSRRRTDRLTD